MAIKEHTLEFQIVMCQDAFLGTYPNDEKGNNVPLVLLVSNYGLYMSIYIVNTGSNSEMCDVAS